MTITHATDIPALARTSAGTPDPTGWVGATLRRYVADRLAALPEADARRDPARRAARNELLDLAGLLDRLALCPQVAESAVADGCAGNALGYARRQQALYRSAATSPRARLGAARMHHGTAAEWYAIDLLIGEMVRARGQDPEALAEAAEQARPRPAPLPGVFGEGAAR